MQDRYAGDVGDFLKLGLLGAVGDGRTRLRLGVNWYLVPDEAHNADGEHVAYLDRGHRHSRSLANARFSEITSDDLSQPQFSHKNRADPD